MPGFNEIVFKPKASNEAIEKGYDFLSKLKTVDKKKMVSFTIVGTGHGASKDMKELLLQNFVNQNCHAHMATGGFLERDLIATDNGCLRVKEEAEAKDLYGRYLQWLTKESCFAPYFFFVDDDFHLKNGFLISSDIPSPLVQNICLATRAFVECSPKGFELFNELYDRYGGDVAFSVVMSSSLSLWEMWTGHFNRSYGLSGDDVFVYNRYWHNVFPLPSTVETLKNFLSRNAPHMVLDKKKYYRTEATIYGGAKYWGEFEGGNKNLFHEFVTTNKDVADEIAGTRKNVKTEIVINPFVVRNRHDPPNQYRWSEVQSIILPAMQDKGVFDVV